MISWRDRIETRCEASCNLFEHTCGSNRGERAEFPTAPQKERNSGKAQAEKYRFPHRCLSNNASMESALCHCGSDGMERCVLAPIGKPMKDSRVIPSRLKAALKTHQLHAPEIGDLLEATLEISAADPVIACDFVPAFYDSTGERCLTLDIGVGIVAVVEKLSVIA